jgi:hypothetical protein
MCAMQLLLYAAPWRPVWTRVCSRASALQRLCSLRRRIGLSGLQCNRITPAFVGLARSWDSVGGRQGCDSSSWGTRKQRARECQPGWAAAGSRALLLPPRRVWQLECAAVAQAGRAQLAPGSLGGWVVSACRRQLGGYPIAALTRTAPLPAASPGLPCLPPGCRGPCRGHGSTGAPNAGAGKGPCAGACQVGAR